MTSEQKQSSRIALCSLQQHSFTDWNDPIHGQYPLIWLIQYYLTHFKLTDTIEHQSGSPMYFQNNGAYFTLLSDSHVNQTDLTYQQ